MTRPVVHMIGQAHLDPAWLWTWPEGRAEALASTRAALDRLDEYPAFVYTRGEAQVYQWVEQEDPALFARLRQQLAAGRWAVVNGMVLQPDMNLPCGETLVRHFLLGKAYIREHLGVEPTVGYCVDSFGHAATIPMILAGCGLDSYVFMRPGPHEMELPGQAFWWQAPDGSRVLAFRISRSYATWSSDTTEHTQYALDDMPPGLGHTMCFYGVGDHGGGPTRAQIEGILAQQAGSDADIRFSHPRAYFDAVLPLAKGLPTVQQELYYHAVGCYAANSNLKRTFRQAEQSLLLAERLVVLSNLLVDRAIPQAELDALWHEVCCNTFHDILGGCTIKQAADDAVRALGSVVHRAGALADDAGRAIAARLDTLGAAGAVVLFNPTLDARQGYIEYEPWTGWQSWQAEEWGLTDEQGEPVPWQLLDSTDAAGRPGHGVQRLVWPIALPPLGYRTYRFGPGAPRTESVAGVSVSADHLTNDLLSLQLDPDTGVIASCVDLATGLELVGPGGWSAAQVLRDTSDTWSHGVRRFDEVVGQFGAPTITVLDSGPLQASLLVERRYEGNMWLQQLTVGAGEPEITLRNWLSWQGRWTMLKLAFDLAASGPHADHDIPFGWIERPCEGDEVPTQMWLAVNGPALADPARTIGLGLINDGLYSCDVKESVARLTVLRCPPYAYHIPHEPGSKPRYDWLDQGLHEFTIVLRPHVGDWRDASIVRRARELNMPPLAITAHGHAGDLAPQASAAALCTPELELAALKPAQDGRGYIVRLVDRHGRGGVGALVWHGEYLAVACAPRQVSSYRLTHSASFWRIEPCDLTERSEKT
jgi:alpha-mannosidase